MVRSRYAPVLLGAALLWAGISPAPAFALETVLSILVVHPDPTMGHAGVHLMRGREQMYWDPGGGYGTELDDCEEVRNTANCEGYHGFPWDDIKRARKNDVVAGAMADLMRVITIYHLDGDAKNEVLTFRLNGALGDTAWRLIADGRENGGKAVFDTDRNAPFCTRAIAEYLKSLAGPFRDIEKTWFPVDLGEQLKALDPDDVRIYTMDHEFVQKTIAVTRKDAGLGPLPAGFRMMKE